MAEDGESIPQPLPIVTHLRDKADWFENPGLWALVTVEIASPMATA